jgi:hypothetical protein
LREQVADIKRNFSSAKEDAAALKRSDKEAQKVLDRHSD